MKMSPKISGNSRIQSERALKMVRDIKGVIESKNLNENALPQDELVLDAIRQKITDLRECVEAIHFKGFRFQDALRKLRNKWGAHFNPEKPEENLGYWRQMFELLPKIEQGLRENIERAYSQDAEVRRFEKFGSQGFGSELERKNLVDAVSDNFGVGDADGEKLSFPEDAFSQNAERLVNGFASQSDDFDFARKHEKLREEISKEIVLYSAKCAEELNAKSLKSEFFDENAFLEKLCNLADSEIADSIQGLKVDFCTLKTAKNVSDVDFGFYQSEFEKLKKRKAKIRELAEAKGGKKPDSAWIERQRERANNELRATADNLKDDLLQSFKKRYEAWLAAELEKRNREFLKDLLERVEKFRKLEELLAPILDEFAPIWKLSNENLDALNRRGYGCDLSRSFFQKSGFELLKQYADLLEQDESIRELAELLGRHRREEVSYEIELREKVKIEAEIRVAPAPKGQICGVETGNNISSVLPSELALYKFPATKDLFKLKFAQKQLLQYKYENFVQREKTVTEMEEVQKANREEKKGPILMCVDTSGSMQGTPEQLAKMLAFALTKIALKEDRKCFMISFSTEIATLDLTEFKQANGIAKLLEFLQMSFHGGTDAGPALAYAVEKLGSEAWQDADVLMISDFQMGNLSQDLIEEIKTARKGGTKFHSLVIGNGGNDAAIACFDNNWNYNPNDPKSQKRLVRQLRKLAQNAETDGSEGES